MKKLVPLTCECGWGADQQSGLWANDDRCRYSYSDSDAIATCSQPILDL